ncbi:50S ribosomal protein L24e [Candidatus Pacearchaeota archaeon]|nr:50S ribosomal protein L24e [Candidatus Pacearchaeota archaeon]
MHKCHICSKPVEHGNGILFVLTDGKIVPFCSSKCRNAYKLKRTVKRLQWTKPKAEKK